MVKVFRFKISFKTTLRGKVRQIVSIPYYDEVDCRYEMNLLSRYLVQAQLIVVGYAIESEFIEYEQVVEESGNGF